MSDSDGKVLWKSFRSRGVKAPTVEWTKKTALEKAAWELVAADMRARFEAEAARDGRPG